MNKVKELQKKARDISKEGWNLLSDLMKPIVVVIGLILFLFIVWKLLMCCVSHYWIGVDLSIPWPRRMIAAREVTVR